MAVDINIETPRPITIEVQPFASACKVQAKTVTPTKVEQSITPDAGYDALSEVTVEAIPNKYADVSGVTATADRVLSGSTFVGKSGATVQGRMRNNPTLAVRIDGLNTRSYSIPSGHHSGGGLVYLTGDIENALAAI